MSAKPDAPIAASADDLLGRLPFVDEIVELAIATPKEWAPRIGIYGAWGSGKTSVLNMVTERLVAAHHIVARFNPWGFHDADEMFDALADSVIEAIENQGAEVKKTAQRAEKITKAVQKSAKLTADATKHVGDFGVPGAKMIGGAVATLGYVTQQLGRLFAKKKLRQLLEALEEIRQSTRCIVLVDDIDRAEPSLLPPLLFALHEVLATIPITFVIALDPIVVGAALQAHHPGFGDGLAFLEKMIQFPRWLPDITREDRWRLATKDVDQYLPVLDRDALRQEFQRFPRNPRELRTLVRGMWGLNSQAKRYRDGEISWNLVLRLAVLRQRHRRTLDILLEDEERLTQIVAFQVADVRQNGKQSAMIDPAIEQALHAAGADVECLPELIEALATRLVWDGATIIRHAHLVERPPAITSLEFEQLVSGLRAASDGHVRDEDVRNALARHAHLHYRSMDQVVDEALSLVLALHDEVMAQSADGMFEQTTIDQAQQATRVVALIRATIRAQSGIPSIDQFRRVLFAFSRWAHFDTLDTYKALHLTEHELLFQLCQRASDPGGYLEVLEPWDRDADRQEQAVLLRRGLEQVLENAVDLTLDRILERHDGVSGMLREHRSSERWCLLRIAAWTPQRIARIGALDSDAASDNALDLLRLLANATANARPSRYGVRYPELDAMAANRAITGALWGVLMRRPLNMRFFTSVEQIKVALDERRGEPLPQPPWWERIRALRDETNARKSKEAADDDHESASVPPEE